MSRIRGIIEAMIFTHTACTVADSAELTFGLVSGDAFGISAKIEERFDFLKKPKHLIV